MGCTFISRNEHFECKCEEELLIRHKYEDEELNAYSKPFSSILQYFIMESHTIPIKKLDEVVLREYSEQMVIMLLNPFFSKVSSNNCGKKAYNAKHIKYFFFLISTATLIKANSKSINDKIGFLYTLVDIKFADDLLTQTINREDMKLHKAVGVMVHIACIVIIDEYLKNLRMKKCKDMNRIKEYKQQISELYIQNLFTVRGQEQNEICYQDIEWQFNSNPYLFTSGDIRRYGWELVKNRIDSN